SEDDLLERDVQDVELRRPHPRQHSLLAMPAQVDVGGEVVAVAQVRHEPDESVGAVARYLLVVRNVAFVEHPADGGDPFLNDRFEVAVDYVGGSASRAPALPPPA